jgi:hypothetical protein
MKITAQFKKEDLWIGVYWRKLASADGDQDGSYETVIQVFICIVPTLPICLTFGEDPGVAGERK